MMNAEPPSSIRQASEHVGQPSLWIDIVELGGGDEGVNRSGTSAALIGAGKGPISSSYGGPVARVPQLIGLRPVALPAEVFQRRAPHRVPPPELHLNDYYLEAFDGLK
jgi:hypothetical protein